MGNQPEVVASYSMNGGSDLHSYSKNSNFQEKGIKSSKELINKSIEGSLDIKLIESSATFGVADLGCATGPNTFVAVQNIIDAVEAKCGKHKVSEIPEFHVFFNDQTANDFNQLFASLPPERRYFAAGVPGSFRDRLFPSGSLHFVFSSYAVQILSTMPKELADQTGPAWNKGKIHYANSPDAVVKAYQAQYAIDMDSFFQARAREIVHGGLMAFLLPGRSKGAHHFDAFYSRTIDLLGSCLVDMANQGKISHEKIDFFNLPTYFTSPEELEEAVKRNGSFSVEIMECVPQDRQQPKALTNTLRAILGGVIKEHFGDDILDHLFGDLVPKKLEQKSSFIFDSGDSVNLFVLLKRI